ncbi:hypothetical protein D3C73_1115260 [compost metagenome]
MDALALEHQIGMGSHAQRAGPPFQARLAQQPVGQQGLTQWCRDGKTPGGTHQHVHISPTGVSASQRFADTRQREARLIQRGP